MSGGNCTVFDGARRIYGGPLHEAAAAFRRAQLDGAAGPLLVFDDATGRVIDINTRGTEEEVTARYSPAPSVTENGSGTPGAENEGAASRVETGSAAQAEEAAPRRRGRPSLGVVAREVTLLPRHWEWLATQPGGASVAIRKLVEEARRTSAAADQRRAARDAAYRFLSAMGGDLPGFEEAARALFADDAARFASLIAAWPADVRDYVQNLAFPDARGGDEDGAGLGRGG
ncbi:DUF2239 family protein [Longimicrobium terrae]|uniref:DUF2239 family protein n=1 Tax=Longimicrobium terrae TaxID=1639882 RepID=A0A841H093_9BACT|nr:hypothetical protein [Longimicrobium terrae]MBB6071475.1 hypothetical protein [Longimicrobium terrae]NNC31308.1 DUF2239 family protein [Longimicrobium terrae]